MTQSADPRLVPWRELTPGQSVYRCDSCRRLVRGAVGLDGDRHEECGVGRLTTVARVTSAMVNDHETASSLSVLDVVA